jgi:SAM-dependent methyltransferase
MATMPMTWVCRNDQQPLERDGESLVCGRCDTRVPTPRGIPCFLPEAMGEADEQNLFERVATDQHELARAIREHGFETGLARFAEERGYRSERHVADWRLLLPTPADGIVLDLAPGSGISTRDLARRCRRVIALVPDPGAAAVLQASCADEVAAGRVEVAMVDSLARLPLGSASVSAIALPASAACAFGLDGTTGAAAFAELARVLAPGGTLLAGARGGLHSLPGARAILERLQSRATRPHVDELVAGARPEPHPPRAGALEAAARRAGLGTPERHAPFPSARRTQAILPVEDRAVVRYFLVSMVRRNSLAMRAAVQTALAINSVGAFRFFVSDLYLIWRKSADGAEGGA